MIYPFPHIENINDVLPSIEGSDDFFITEKEDYTVINYRLLSSSTFPPVIDPSVISDDLNHKYNHKAAIRRECRGLIFDKKGKLLRRAYHKFFNINEREETLLQNVDFSENHSLLEKVDGSMITPIWLDGNLRLATKAGITSVAMDAEYFIADKPNYKSFMKLCHDHNITPIFEYVSNTNRIVIEYPENLILTAMRRMDTGTYFDYTLLRVHALQYNIPLVQWYHNTSTSMNEYIDSLSLTSDIEGVVIRFASGHMVKVKTLWYVAIHRAKDNLLHEKRVIELIMNDKVDDVLSFLPDKDKEKLEKYRDKFIAGYNATLILLRDHYYPKAKELSRKDFALTILPTIPSAYGTIIFNCWDKGKEHIEQSLKDMIVDSTISQTKVDKTRHLWGNVTWNYRGVEE